MATPLTGCLPSSERIPVDTLRGLGRVLTILCLVAGGPLGVRVLNHTEDRMYSCLLVSPFH